MDTQSVLTPSSNKLTWRRRLYEVLEFVDSNNTHARIFNVLLLILIILNAGAVVIETLPLSAEIHQWLFYFEKISLIVFTVEYVLRLWVCVENKVFEKPVAGRIRYATRLLSLVDLMVFLPLWLHLAGFNLSALRIFRVFRLLKFGRLMRYSKAYHFIGEAINAKRDELIASLFLMLMIILVASSLLYFVEHEAQPAIFSSIPATFWWAFVTFMTVGYGDAYPITVSGKIIASFFMLIGVSIFALPTSILTASMLDVIQRAKRHKHSVDAHLNKQDHD
jgi:voltage-gated potassium channel